MRWARVAVSGVAVSLAAGWAWLRVPGEVAGRGGRRPATSGVAMTPPPAPPPPPPRSPLPEPVAALQPSRAPSPPAPALEAAAPEAGAGAPGSPGPEPGSDGGALAEGKRRFLGDLEAALRVVAPEVEACRSAWRETDPSLASLEVEFALVPGDGGYGLEPRFLGDAGLGQVALQGCMHNVVGGLQLEGLNQGLEAGRAVLGRTVMRIRLRPAPAADAG